MSDQYHVPVMLRETVDMLVTATDGSYMDGTLGGGGHTAALLERLDPGGRLYAFDADPHAIAHARERFGDAVGRQLNLRQAWFSEACQWLAAQDIRLHGAMLDLGISSRQIDTDQIGLSYRQTMPLDMRFDPESDRPSARDLIGSLSREDLSTLLRTYGEEPAAWKIAGAIVEQRNRRKIETTTDLRETIAEVIPDRFLMPTLSRVFQALRIAVNDELGELERALDLLVGLLIPGGRVVVLTYHSLEDRIVKEKFRDEARTCVCPPELPVCRCGKVQRLRLLTRKPVLPSSDEIERNPRARSAKLRAAERIVDTRSASAVPPAAG